MTLDQLLSQIYKSAFTGAQIDEAILRIRRGDIDTLAEAAAQSASSASQSAISATSAAAAAADSESAAAASKAAAEESAQDSEDSALLSRSWAAGETGARPGEDSNNSKYWAGKAQAYAEAANNPVVVQGVYNYVLEDRDTGDRYALLIESGTLKLLGVPDTMDATEMVLIDTVAGTKQQLIVESGNLKLLEVE